MLYIYFAYFMLYIQFDEKVANMKNLDDGVLLDIYKKASELKLDRVYITIIENELTSRGLSLTLEKENNKLIDSH